LKPLCLLLLTDIAAYFLLVSAGVKKFGLTVTSLTNLELVEEVHRAVDNKFRRLVTQARGQWEQTFAKEDPSDACVSVKIDPAPETPARAPVRGSAFVKSTKKIEQGSKISLPRFAH
jgi:hypothetical protein